MTDVKQTVEELSQVNNSKQETVKDYVERAVKGKTQDTRDEEADREKRKTNVIVHGLPESTATNSDVRLTDDVEALTTMLQEINCEKSKLNK